MSNDLENAKRSALANFESIKEMVEKLEAADEADDHDARDEACSAILEDALSVQVRSGWYSPGEQPEAEEFEILLSTGGPAVRIIGEIGLHGEPEKPRIECQDWFQPWTEVYIDDPRAAEILDTYCRQFYFGD